MAAEPNPMPTTDRCVVLSILSLFSNFLSLILDEDHVAKLRAKIEQQKKMMAKQQQKLAEYEDNEDGK